jgi:hypothetical protein
MAPAWGSLHPTMWDISFPASLRLIGVADGKATFANALSPTPDNEPLSPLSRHLLSTSYG